ncbi:PREDICTED: uncharacterized protein LOC104802047 [Tarenaya hassleriana]|uniref:uncharacterized protein LOC104802047 n=1 Tax=Tarenaya hassleriana TaxID=28532 RepID=UPI00053C0842|nr:PREDICTED: uncharacterized protein LOC104802047 [Tarenaya hassleriana]
MAEQEDVRPLSPAAVVPASHVEDSLKENLRRRNHIRWCCGFVGVTSFVLTIVLPLVLFFTVFQAKDPIIVVNNVTMPSLPGTQFPPPDITANMSMVVDVSVKNPNAASFKYSNTTTELYYKGLLFGEARGPPGRARARRTVRMNVTLDIYAGRLMSDPGLLEDIGSGLMNVTSYSRVHGRVKILGFLKAQMTVKMNCSTSFNVTSRSILRFKCKRKFNL